MVLQKIDFIINEVKVKLFKIWYFYSENKFNVKLGIKILTNTKTVYYHF